MLNCKFTNDLWTNCARKIGINLNTGTHNNIWSRISINGRIPQLASTLATALCLNIWREWNNRIFYSIAWSLHVYIGLIIHNVIIWTDILSDDERVQILEDHRRTTWKATNFLQDNHDLEDPKLEMMMLYCTRWEPYFTFSVPFYFM